MNLLQLVLPGLHCRQLGGSSCCLDCIADSLEAALVAWMALQTVGDAWIAQQTVGRQLLLPGLLCRQLVGRSCCQDCTTDSCLTAFVAWIAHQTVVRQIVLP